MYPSCHFCNFYAAHVTAYILKKIAYPVLLCFSEHGGIQFEQTNNSQKTYGGRARKGKTAEDSK